MRTLPVVIGFFEPVVPLLTLWRHDALLLAVGEADPCPLHTHKGMIRAYTGAGVDTHLHFLTVASEPDMCREGNLLSDGGQLGVKRVV